MKRSTTLVAFAFGAVAGILTGWLLWHEAPAVSEAPTRPTKPSGALEEKPAAIGASRVVETSSAPSFGEKSSPVPGRVTLDLKTLMAITPKQLNAQSLTALLQKMGLPPEQIKAVEFEREEAMERFKKLESANARIESGPEGDYVVIEAFPEALEPWFLEMERNLRKIVSDDRATLISRMIALMDNDELVGLRRREVFLREKTDAGNNTRMLIEERTFEPDGSLIDTDFEAIADRIPKRWEHLLQNGKP